MASIGTLPAGTGVVDIEEHFDHTSARLNEDPLTRPSGDPAQPPGLVTQFDAIGPRIEAALAEDKALERRLLRAVVRVEYADKELDLISAIAAAVCKDKPVQQHDLFGDQRPSDFRRPILSVQLEKMLLWPQTLEQSAVPELRALVPRIQAALDAAQAAQDEHKAATAALELFRTQTLNPLVNDFNALRMRVFGELGTRWHQQGEAKGLGAGWASSFFRRVRARRRVTLRNLEHRIATRKAQLAALEKRRDELVQQASDVTRAKAAAQRQALQAQLEASRKAAEAMNAQVQELQAAMAQIQDPSDEPDLDMPVDDDPDEDELLDNAGAETAQD